MLLVNQLPAPAQRRCSGANVTQRAGGAALPGLWATGCPRLRFGLRCRVVWLARRLCSLSVCCNVAPAPGSCPPGPNLGWAAAPDRRRPPRVRAGRAGRPAAAGELTQTKPPHTARPTHNSMTLPTYALRQLRMALFIIRYTQEFVQSASSCRVWVKRVLAPHFCANWMWRAEKADRPPTSVQSRPFPL